MLSPILFSLLLAQAAPISRDEDPCPDLPPLTDLDRFPSVATAWEQVSRHRQHLRWMEHCGALPILDARFGREWHEAQIAATRKHLAAWELLANVKAGAPEAFRWWGIPPRALLAMLRDELGWADYDRGQMPQELPEIQYEEWTLPARPAPPAPLMARAAGTNRH